ncbi:MAG: sugar phosphate isomerase/epimerase family protein [Planctomycetota bacterium]|jgi:sugar phosphate isomerase/epimerase
MLIGYNTNGFSYHRLEDCFAILSEIGYQSVAVTLDQPWFHPPDGRGVAPAVRALRPLSERYGMRLTIETGARFILDPRRKHQPTLISLDAEQRRRRLDYLEAAIDVAADVGADAVSCWSGQPDSPDGNATLVDRLLSSLKGLMDHAERRGVRVAFEPEPGMLVATMSDFEIIHDRLDHGNFGLTLDVGHVHCLRDGHVADHIRRWRGVLWNVHLEDMKRDVHDHLAFGDGDMEFDPIAAALVEVGYTGPVHVELSRHSHQAMETARVSHEFVKTLLERARYSTFD